MKRSSSPENMSQSPHKRLRRDVASKLHASLHRSVSPPPRKIRGKAREDSARRKDLQEVAPCAPTACDDSRKTVPRSSAVESGETSITDHLSYFSHKLEEATRPSHFQIPRISHDAWINLYKRNQHRHGHHFVIHQHDHPVAGTHYDLRLQISETSSISWAIMYGLPGNANSRRLNRNATETRVHCLWVCLASIPGLGVVSVREPIWSTPI